MKTLKRFLIGDKHVREILNARSPKPTVEEFIEKHPVLTAAIVKTKTEAKEVFGSDFAGFRFEVERGCSCEPDRLWLCLQVTCHAEVCSEKTQILTEWWIEHEMYEFVWDLLSFNVEFVGDEKRGK